MWDQAASVWRGVRREFAGQPFSLGLLKPQNDRLPAKSMATISDAQTTTSGVIGLMLFITSPPDASNAPGSREVPSGHLSVTSTLSAVRKVHHG